MADLLNWAPDKIKSWQNQQEKTKLTKQIKDFELAVAEFLAGELITASKKVNKNIFCDINDLLLLKTKVQQAPISIHGLQYS